MSLGTIMLLAVLIWLAHLLGYRGGYLSAVKKMEQLVELERQKKVQSLYNKGDCCGCKKD